MGGHKNIYPLREVRNRRANDLPREAYECWRFPVAAIPILVLPRKGKAHHSCAPVLPRSGQARRHIPLYTPATPPVIPLYSYRGGLQGDYRGITGGVEGVYRGFRGGHGATKAGTANGWA